MWGWVRKLLGVKEDESDVALDEVDWVEAGFQDGSLLHDLRRCGVVRSSGFLCPWLEEIPPGDVPGVGASFREISSYLQKAAFDNMARAAHKEDLVFSDRMVEKEDFE